MLKNYFKITMRYLWKNKTFSFINITGLAIGMACCLLIMLYVQDELSYDRFHKNADRIYRTTIEWFNSDGTTSLHLGHIAPPYKDLMLNDFDEIEKAVRLLGAGGALVRYGDKTFREDNFFFAEEDFFEIFSFPLIAGDPETVLKDPLNIIVTENSAQKYFGNEDPLNKPLEFDFSGRKVIFNVVGVAKNVPENSHFHFDMLGSFKTYEAVGTDLESFGSNNYATYLLLPENYDIRKLDNAMPAFIDRHLREDASKGRLLRFQKLTDIHLHSHLDSEIEPNGDIKYIYIFTVIAFFVLLIACINFMNLATARSAGRAREVGLRKVVGAERSQLIRQFLGETILLAVFALILSLVLVYIGLPWFRIFTGKLLPISVDNILFLTGSLTGITLFVGIVAGSYPAFFLSSFRPARILRGTVASGAKSSVFRMTLVVSQFAISIILIICMYIVYGQLQYVRNAKLGFDKEHVVVIRANPEMISRYDAIRDRLTANPDIINAAASKRVPSGRLLDDSGSRVYKSGTEEPVEFRIAYVPITHDFISTYRMEIASGRDFSRSFSTDSLRAFILNETAVKKIGWTAEEAVGQDFKYGGRTGKIIGVLKDFHFESMHQQISPMVFFLRSTDINNFSIRLAPGNIPETMNFLAQIWQEYRPGYPFDYYFIDENFDTQYEAEEKLGEIFGYFSFLAVVIACLGLYGLAAFTAEKRTKEIGIRKVLGASVNSIIGLLTKEFIKLVLIANLIAWPAAYFAMNVWLQDFAYRTEIGYVEFISASLITLIIALLTVIYQAAKAALSNPVEAIKYELS